MLITKINQDIRDDYQLGRGYEIGHSFFTSITNQMDEHKWFEHVMTFEIKPLLEEYYFDRPEKVKELIQVCNMSNNFKVPIRNVFYLLSYAHDSPEMVKSLNEVEDNLLTFDFLVEQFNLEVQALLDKGLVKNYVSSVQETSNLSGRLLLDESMPHIVRKKPIVVSCEKKDDILKDILLNQVMKATLERIHWNPKVNEKNQRTSFHLWEELYPVSSIVLTKEIFLRMNFTVTICIINE